MTTPDLARMELSATTDAQIDEALMGADPMTLRGLLYQLTGDERLADIAVVDAQVMFGQAAVPASEADADAIRAKAAAYLRDLRDAGTPHVDFGPPERLPRAIELAVGSPRRDEQLAMLIEDLGLDPWARELKWARPPDPERLAGFSVTVIGAGYAGLNAALMLKRAGIPYVHLERHAGVGGTWFANGYPGARVDSPSRAYNHIFGAEFELTSPFCPRAENRAYFDWVADEFDLRDHIRFETSVRSLTWDDADTLWTIEVEGPGGPETLRSNAVITAVGFLSQPKMPDIAGIDDFAGPSWHASRWPEEFAVEGKRIAVVGSGATGYQLVPELALAAGSVVAFQRTPSWVFGFPGYRSPSPPQSLWVDRNMPFYKNFLRVRGVDVLNAWDEITDVDPDYADPYATSAFNRLMYDNATAQLEAKLGGTALLAKMTPDYPVWVQRPVLADAEYNILDAVRRENVQLVTDPIAAVNATGIATVSGDQFDVDAIVYATGFRANDYLFPMRVTGRDATLEQVWQDEGTYAYRTCMVPGFPNLWMLHGPNTVGGLVTGQWVEVVTRYALRCVERLIADGLGSIEVSAGACAADKDEADARHARKTWSDPRGSSYYQGPDGRPSAVLSPYGPQAVGRMFRDVDFEAMVLAERPA
jgi:4-hydroxyacetophenone monooxygenase